MFVSKIIRILVSLRQMDYTYIYGLLTRREVKMALDREESRSINTHRKRTRRISSNLDLTGLVNKGFIIWKKNISNINGLEWI